MRIKDFFNKQFAILAIIVVAFAFLITFFAFHLFNKPPIMIIATVEEVVCVFGVTVFAYLHILKKNIGRNYATFALFLALQTCLLIAFYLLKWEEPLSLIKRMGDALGLTWAVGVVVFYFLWQILTNLDLVKSFFYDSITEDDVVIYNDNHNPTIIGKIAQLDKDTFVIINSSDPQKNREFSISGRLQYVKKYNP